MSTALFARLVDDASMFPPGNLPLDEAVPAHRRHREAEYRNLVGTFVCSDVDLPKVDAAAGRTSLRVSVVLTRGAGDILSVAGYADPATSLEVTAVEVRLRSEDDLVRNTNRIAVAVREEFEGEVFVETGFEGDWLGALDVIAEEGMSAKLRTGGLEADTFPPAARVAEFIEACLDREITFKCTAGLHHAVRHTAADTGFEHHGFLNVLLATRAALDGATRDDLVDVLEDRDGPALAEKARALTEKQAKSVRRWFTSFGSCSISEPVEDLTGLGLLR
jgi:hypothetical protein